ncbi:SH3 domain-containing protein [Seohaeicola saemankumensis]|uniref:SH3 domain-containing protein n=1 Tax=Seohaeicola saemankumensis TaxID=481181 RepID=A0ABW3TH30_9RHOB
MTQLKFRADRGFVRAYRMIAAVSVLLLLAGFTPQAYGAERGSVTNLPLPRYVSIKSAEVNVRRGPSLTHRVDWVFKRKDMPVEITAEHGHWRRVRDRDGAGGWVHYSLLSGNRTVIVDQDMLPLLSRPEQNAPASAQLEQGVVARLDNCTADWCRLSAGGYRGWAPKNALWGVKLDEVLE